MQFVSSRKHINVSYDRSNYTDESFVKSKLFTQICCVIHVSKLLNMCMLIPCIDDYLDKNVLLNFERLNEHCLPQTPRPLHQRIGVLKVQHGNFVFSHLSTHFEHEALVCIQLVGAYFTRITFQTLLFNYTQRETNET